MKAKLTYKLNEPLPLDAVRKLYHESALAGQRPVEYPDSMLQMLKCANLIVSAWNGDQLVGMLRTMTDFCYIAYLTDLAIHRDFEKYDIGRKLILATQAQLAPYCMVVVIAAPDDEAYYNSIGFSEYKPTYFVTAENFICS